VHYFNGHALGDNILGHANQAPLGLDKFKHVYEESTHVLDVSKHVSNDSPSHLKQVHKLFVTCFNKSKDVLCRFEDASNEF
jgi:hypothetical protein